MRLSLLFKAIELLSYNNWKNNQVCLEGVLSEMLVIPHLNYAQVLK